MATRRIPKNNSRIAEMLQKVVQHKRNVLTDMPRADTPELKRRKQAMRFAINALSRVIEEILTLDFEIKKGADVLTIRGIGKGTASRIDEFLETGTLQELKDFKPRQRPSDLGDVFGLGPAAVRKLAEKGVATVAELKSAVTSGMVQMPDAVLQGILYYRDLKLRIPREEMNRFNRILSNVRKALGKDVCLDLCGSYRRRRPDCGDLDVLVTSMNTGAKSTEQQVQTLLQQFVQQLTLRKLLIAHLGEGSTKFTGIVMHPKIGIARRLDVRWVPHESYATALMYFTGSKDFNVMMRRKAIDSGYKLSEYSLSDRNGRALPIYSEHDIFEQLQVPYMPPEAR